MKSSETFISSGSQTVGPYFGIGLEYLIDQEPVDSSTPGAVELCGKVLDRDGAPVPDALLEFWGADSSGAYADAIPSSGGRPAGFHRVATDAQGDYSLILNRPGATPFGDSRLQAPHMLVLVFARGLLRHLVTRVYFGDESSNTADPVLVQVPFERRHTLVAQTDAKNPRVFQWNVILQGKNETAFFAW
jgi:protocatechuate 3,4-dioxygenase alpha subunit